MTKWLQIPVERDTLELLVRLTSVMDGYAAYRSEFLAGTLLREAVFEQAREWKMTPSDVVPDVEVRENEMRRTKAAVMIEGYRKGC